MFKGIPFAAPPTGSLRWREPQPVPSWKGVRKADAFAARCMQLPVFSDMKFRSNGVSEDCLYLNVWTATTDAKARQPVLVYFYGAGSSPATVLNTGTTARAWPGAASRRSP